MVSLRKGENPTTQCMLLLEHNKKKTLFKLFPIYPRVKLRFLDGWLPGLSCKPCSYALPRKRFGDQQDIPSTHEVRRVYSALFTRQLLFIHHLHHPYRLSRVLPPYFFYIDYFNCSFILFLPSYPLLCCLLCAHVRQCVRVFTLFTLTLASAHYT